jgi:hypothetical protein
VIPGRKEKFGNNLRKKDFAFADGWLSSPEP